MNSVWIPTQMQVLTNGEAVVEVNGENIRQVIKELDERYPGIADFLIDNKTMKPGIAVAINGEISNLGLYEVVESDSEIHFVPAIEGG